MPSKLKSLWYTLLFVFISSNVFATQKVEVYSRDEALNEINMSKPRIYIKNVGTEAVSDFFCYYYLTADRNKTPIIEKYYVPNSVVTLEQVDGFDYRIKYDFTGVTLQPGDILPDKNGNVIGIRYDDWGEVDKTNDYSFNNSQSFLTNRKITVHDKNGFLIQGEGPVVEPVSLALEFKDESFSYARYLTPNFKITNNSNRYLNDLSIYFYFTAEENEIPQVTGTISGGKTELQYIGGDEYRLKYVLSDTTLMPDATVQLSSGNVPEISYQSSSALDKTNDYSYDKNEGVWKSNQKTILRDEDGNLIYGELPRSFFVPFVSGATRNEKPVMEMDDKITEGLDLSYSFPSAEMSVEEVSGQIFQRLDIDAYGHLTEVGKPQLPSKIINVLLPNNADINLRVGSVEKKSKKGFHIYPAQEIPYDDIYYESPKFQIDEKLYGASELYPETNVELLSIQEIRGARIAQIRINPVQYCPADSTIVYTEDIDFSVDFIGEDKDFIFSLIGVVIGVTVAVIINNNVVNKHATPPPEPPSVSPSRGELLVITHPDYTAATEKFVLWKRQMGYSVQVESRTNWTSTTIKNLAHSLKPHYLLLLGDEDKVPPAETWIESFEISKTETLDLNVPSDLKYVCFDGSNDFFPDVAYGRIPATSVEEADNAVSKIIHYEQNPPEDHTFYSTTGTLAYFQDNDKNGFADRYFVNTCWNIGNYLSNHHNHTLDRLFYAHSNVNPTHWKDESGIPGQLLRPNFSWDASYQQINQAIEDGRSLVLYRGHGWMTKWANPYYGRGFAANLANSDELPIVLSISCLTGHYNDGYWSFAEAFSTHSHNGGAVGVLAASTSSKSYPNDDFATGLVDAIWPNPGMIQINPHLSNQTPRTPLRKMGNVMQQGLFNVANEWGANGAKEHYKIYHWFGDPSMSIWSEIPGHITANYSELSLGQSTLELTTNISSGFVTLFQNDQVLVSEEIQSNHLILNIPGFSQDFPITIVVTSSNNDHKPYIDNYLYNPIPDGPVRYVDETAEPGGCGRSWGTAFTNLQDALTELNGSNSTVNEIRIAQGTYFPDRGEGVERGDRDAQFEIYGVTGREIRILGGFPNGGGENPDPDVNPVVLSGRINPEQNQSSKQILDIQYVTRPLLIEGITFSGAWGEGLGVVNINQAYETSILDCDFVNILNASGCVLQLSYIQGNTDIEGCNFEDNVSERVMAVFNSTEELNISNSGFRRNSTTETGALNLSSIDKNVKVSGCVFDQNTINSSSNQGGAGMTVDMTGNVELQNCRFTRNSSPMYGGAVYLNRGAPCSIVNCYFEGNQAHKGGAVFSNASSFYMVNSSFVQNWALRNNGIVGEGAAIYFANSYDARIENSIVYNNLSGNLTSPYHEKRQIGFARTRPDVNYSCIHDPYNDLGVYPCPDGEQNENLDVAPLLLEDGMLSPDSPCINQGKTGIDMTMFPVNSSGKPVDIAGNLRVLGAVIDIGAYEVD